MNRQRQQQKGGAKGKERGWRDGEGREVGRRGTAEAGGDGGKKDERKRKGTGRGMSAGEGGSGGREGE